MPCWRTAGATDRHCVVMATGRSRDGQIRTAMTQSAGWLLTRPAIRSGSTAVSARSAPSPSGNSGSTRRCSSVSWVIQIRRRVIWNNQPPAAAAATGT